MGRSHATTKNETPGGHCPSLHAPSFTPLHNRRSICFSTLCTPSISHDIFSLRSPLSFDPEIAQIGAELVLIASLFPPLECLSTSLRNESAGVGFPSDFLFLLNLKLLELVQNCYRSLLFSLVLVNELAECECWVRVSRFVVRFFKCPIAWDRLQGEYR